MKVYGEKEYCCKNVSSFHWEVIYLAFLRLAVTKQTTTNQTSEHLFRVKRAQLMCSPWRDAWHRPCELLLTLERLRVSLHPSAWQTGPPVHTQVHLRCDAAAFSIGLKTRAVVTWTHPCYSSHAKFSSLWILLPPLLPVGRDGLITTCVGCCWPPPFKPGFKGSVDTPLVSIVYLLNIITMLFGTRCKKKRQY